jgi:hypothetical protein
MEIERQIAPITMRTSGSDQATGRQLDDQRAGPVSLEYDLSEAAAENGTVAVTPDFGDPAGICGVITPHSFANETTNRANGAVRLPPR